MTASRTAPRLRRLFLDLAFDDLTTDQALGWILAREKDARFAYIVTPNVDHMVRFASLSHSIRGAYEEADLCLCDSRILQRTAKLLGYRLALAPGSDITRRLLDCLSLGDRVLLVGGSADQGAALSTLYPSLDIVQHLPPMGLLHDRAARTAAVAAAAIAGARITLLAVGAPQQELIALEMRDSDQVSGTALCIGASVNFLVGSERRAPQILQRMGFEWAWRLAQDPRRLAYRYLIQGPRIFPIAWTWAKAQRKRR